MGAQTLIKFRRGTDTDWSNANPTLSVGEPGYDTTAEKFKIGDGTTSWSSLGYIGDGNSGIDGSGTSGNIPKFSDSDTIGDSVIKESSGGEIGIGSITPAVKGSGATALLDVDGPILARGGVSANQTDAGVLDYASNILRVRAYGNTSGTGEIQWRVGGGGGSADALGMYLNSSKDLTHYGDTALIADASSYELSISGSAATLGGNRLQLLGAETVVNNAGSTIDFRVEGDTDANLLFVDADTDRVGIGTSSPSRKLHVVGDLLIDDGSAIVLDANGLKITDDTIGATLDSNCSDAIVIGEGARNYSDKSINIANGRFSNNGDCQKISQVLRGSTTDASRFYLSTDGSQAGVIHSGAVFLAGTAYGNIAGIVLPDNAVFTFSINISCRKQSSNDSAAWIIKGAVRNSSGWGGSSQTLFSEASVTSTMNYNLIGSPIIESFIDSGLSGITAEVTTSYYNSDTTNSVSNAWFGIEVHGLASTNLRWSAMVDGILTTY